MKYLILFIILNPIYSSFSQWKETEINFAYNYKPEFQEAYLETLNGVCQLIPNYSKKAIQGRHLIRRGLFPKYFHKKQAYHLVLQEDQDGLPIKAPLVVVYPGSFTELKEKQATMWLQLFSNLGFHVLQIPNPWSESFIDADSLYTLGHFEKEADSLVEITNYEINKLIEYGLVDKQNIQLVGLSYGAFLAAIVNYKLKKFNNLTLISPPLNLYNSFMVFDQNLKDFLSKGVKLKKAKTLYFFANSCFSDKDAKISEAHKNWAKYIVTIEGFQKELAKSLELYSKLNNLNYVPKNAMKKRKWQNQLLFSDFFNMYNPQLLSLYQSKKAQLMFWLNKAKAERSQNIRILSSTNDFINPEQSINKSNHFIYLDRGGHFGFAGTRWFEDFIALSF